MASRFRDYVDLYPTFERTITQTVGQRLACAGSSDVGPVREKLIVVGKPISRLGVATWRHQTTHPSPSSSFVDPRTAALPQSFAFNQARGP